MTGLIIDDDPLMVQTVEHFVEKSELVESCRHAGDVATAVNMLGQHRFDFVLLDLHLPDLPGQSALDSIAPETPVIVVSSDAGFGAASYSYPNIIDYLVKPINYVGFHRAMQCAFEFGENVQAATSSPTHGDEHGQSIFVKSGSEIVRVSLDEVLYVKAEANYVSFHFCNNARAVMTLASLTKIAGQLPASFIRTHRSYIVNRAHIDRLDGQSIHLANQKIPIGDSFRTEFLRKLGVLA